MVDSHCLLFFKSTNLSSQFALALDPATEDDSTEVDRVCLQQMVTVFSYRVSYDTLPRHASVLDPETKEVTNPVVVENFPLFVIEVDETKFDKVRTTTDSLPSPFESCAIATMYYI